MSVHARITLSILPLALILPTLASAACAEFPRTLKEGSRGSDVLELQRVLNQDPATQIARSGAGSPGHEITTFGPKVTAALKKFQERYRNVTLTAAGIKNPDGIAGPATRKKLRELSCALPTAAKPASVKSTNGITLDTPSVYQVRVGDTITLTGKNISTADTVNLGSASRATVKPLGDSLTFTIPEDAPLGVTSVTVHTKNGTSGAIELFIGRKGKGTSGSAEACIDITRTLKEGEVGGDVVLLQKFLNTDARTKVASEGIGSPGRESSTYTSAVTDAVGRFQTLYASDILIPAKLSSPTGITSLFTADKIREITCGSKKLTPEQKEQAKETEKKAESVDAAALRDVAARQKKADALLSAMLDDANTSAAATRAIIDKLTLYHATWQTGATGDTIKLRGRNFAQYGNSVYICGNLAMSNLTSDGYAIEYSAAANSAPLGSCTVKVVNQSGTSESVALLVTKSVDAATLASTSANLNDQTLQNAANSGDYTSILKSLGF